MQSNITLKSISRRVLGAALSLLILLALSNGSVLAQGTITTTNANVNGSSVVTFNLTNNNAFGVIITSISSVPGATSASMAVAAYFKTTPVAGPPIAINTANGWTQFGSANVPTVANTTTNVGQPFMSGLSLLIPAGATYGLAVFATNLRYGGTGTTGATTTITNGGVTYTTGPNIGYGGSLTFPTNSPRYFLGSITFIAAVPCSGTPTPGNTTSTATSACPGIPFTLGTQNATAGTGVTYTYQSGPSATGPFTTIPAASGPTFTTTQTAATFYQVIVQCGAGTPVTAAPVQVALTPPSACYCTSTALQIADEDIFNVTLGTLNNTSTCASVGPGPGSVTRLYANYTSGTGAPAAPNLVQGSTMPISIAVGTCGGTFGNGTAVFIDFNQDGDFVVPVKKFVTATTTPVAPRSGLSSFRHCYLGNNQDRVRLFSAGTRSNRRYLYMGRNGRLQ
ncbi:MAG: hypothetical protein WKF88_10435 [Ferruginibacter sp.]